jgi:hypothetical protein
MVLLALGMFEFIPDSHLLICTNRKTQAALEFAAHIQHNYSVFWLCGSSCDAIQDWVIRAFYMIKPDIYKTHLINHQALLRNWLMDEENGKWILIVDDLCVETELQTLLPPPVAWGKIIFTSRQDSPSLSFPVMKLPMPPLSPEDGLSLLWSRSRLNANYRISEISETSPLFLFIRNLCDEPAAIAFAASCLISSNPSSAAEDLGTLEDEGTLSCPSEESKTLKWASITIDDLSFADMFILSLFFFFDCRKISEEAIDAILAPSRSGSDLFEVQYIQRTALRRALEQLVSRQLLKCEHDPWSVYYSMPRVIQEVLAHKFANDRKKFSATAKIARSLICTAYEQMNFNTVSDFENFMSIINPHCHAISLVVTLGKLETSAVGVRFLSEAIFLHNLMKAIEVGVRRSTKQFFRKLMVQNGYEISNNSKLITEDEGSSHLGLDTTSSWLKPSLTSEETQLDDLLIKPLIRESIKDSLWECLRDSITVGVIGRAWQGIREDIFDYIRTNRNSRSDSEVSAIIDFVDKGGCDGQLAAIRTYMQGDTFKREMMDRAGTDVIRDITKLVNYVVDDDLAGLNDKTIADAVQDALGFLTHLTFLEISNGFDAMFVPLKGCLQIMLETPLEHSTPEGFRSLVAFTVGNMTGDYIRTHTLSMGRAFWEVVSSAHIWIAAAIVSHIGFAVLKASTPATTTTSFQEPGSSSLLRDEQRHRWLQQVTAFNTRSMELVREGIIAFHSRSTPEWRLSLRKATYSCLLAEESRRGWAEDDADAFDYRNQERWEEVCILLDMTEAVWPLS